MASLAKQRRIKIFFEKVAQIHNNLYDYSNSKYINSHTNIKVYCPLHKVVFDQRPSDHLQGSVGCEGCYLEARAKSLTKTTEWFIKKAQKLHGNFYDYSKFIYTGSFIPGIIICPIHGEFLQKPDYHLRFGRNVGCPPCGKERTKQIRIKSLEQFIIDAHLIHNNKYDYSSTVYDGDAKNLTIICPTHGPFSMRANDHMNGQGCVKCSKNISKKEIKWLNSLSIPDDKQHRQVRITIDDKTITVDGYLPNTNTIYEFYGDYWHGNLAIYSSDNINRVNKTSFGQLYQKTLDREKLIKEAGYNLITVWESDFLASQKKPT